MIKPKSGNIGNVIEVNSERVIIEVSDELTNYNIIHEGNLYRIGQVGSFVKIINGLTSLYGVVESFSTFLQTGDITIDKKVINIALLGYRNVLGEFEKGSKITPSINDSAYVIDQEDIEIIFKIDVKYPVKLGDNYFSAKLPVYINLNEFILKHSFIVGSTGSGKSNTVAYLLSNIVKDYPSSRALIIDIHGEYMNYLSDSAKEFSVYSETENLIIPYWMLDFDTLCKLLGFSHGNVMSSATDIFRDRILQMKKEHVEACHLKEKININDIDVNSPIPFSIKDIWFEFYSRGYGTFNEVSRMPPNYAFKEKGGIELKGDAETLEKPQFKEYTTDRTAPFKSNETYFRSIADNMLNMLNNDDFKFMFGEHEYIKDTTNIEKMISSWIDNEKQLTVLNLSGIPYKIVDVVIGIISNLLFDVVYYSLKINRNYEGRPLLICFEEAHKYLKQNTQTSYSQQAVERIMKEGRKFGIGAMIISQRPVEIPNNIISQVSTFIALRLTNSEDQSKISSFAPNNFATFLESFPSLGNGDAFVIGESLKIPMKIKIPLLKSVGNTNFDKKIGAWTIDRKNEFSYVSTIERWIKK
jgi:hypothetical protein